MKTKKITMKITNRADAINCIEVLNNAINILNGTKKFGEITLLSNCIYPSLTIHEFMNQVLDNWVMHFDKIDEEERAIRISELQREKESLMEFLKE